jgi:hypothetical protein
MAVTRKIESNHKGGRKQRDTEHRSRAIKIVSNVPENLPILPEEVALIAEWWPDLFHILNANDNKDAANGDA